MGKYRVGNAGGGTFLIDKEGKILLIQLTAEEVKSYLDKFIDYVLYIFTL